MTITFTLDTEHLPLDLDLDPRAAAFSQFRNASK
jgi:hypothetical protein